MISIPTMEFGGVTFDLPVGKWSSEHHEAFQKVTNSISEKKRDLGFVLTVSKVRALIESLSPSSRDLVLQQIVSILETCELRDTKIRVPSGLDSDNSGALLQWFKELTDYYAAPSESNNFSAKWIELCNSFHVSTVFNDLAKSVLV